MTTGQEVPASEIPASTSLARQQPTSCRTWLPHKPSAVSPHQAAGKGDAPSAGPCFREALTSAMTQKSWRQKCGNQRLLKVLASDWLLMSFLLATGLSSGLGGAELGPSRA